MYIQARLLQLVVIECVSLNLQGVLCFFTVGFGSVGAATCKDLRKFEAAVLKNYLAKARANQKRLTIMPESSTLHTYSGALAIPFLLGQLGQLLAANPKTRRCSMIAVKSKNLVLAFSTSLLTQWAESVRQFGLRPSCLFS